MTAVLVLTPHKVVCAWCQVLMADGILPISHGLCAVCSARVLQEEC